MSSIPGKDWAYFIVDKLGFKYTKKTIIEYASSATNEEVWYRFVASNPVYLKAAKANRINGPADVSHFFSDRKYAQMRSTFPSRARGRSIIGTRRILTIEQLKEQQKAEEARLAAYRCKLSETPSTGKYIPSSVIGKRIIHKGSTLCFGIGSIVDIDNTKGTITVVFDDGKERKLRYYECLEKNYIRFED